MKLDDIPAAVQKKQEKTVEIQYIANPLLEKWKQNGHLKGAVK